MKNKAPAFFGAANYTRFYSPLLKALAWSLPLDVVEEEEAYLVKASIPGIKPEELEIACNKGLLTIQGTVKDKSESTKGQFHLRERRFGTFSRTISLPATVKAGDIQAKCENGIITLRIPKVEGVKPKRIPIQSAGEQKTISAHSN